MNLILIKEVIDLMRENNVSRLKTPELELELSSFNKPITKLEEKEQEPVKENESGHWSDPDLWAAS